METKLQEAVKTLVEVLKTDKDYRNGWKANIAMAFFDEFSKRDIDIEKTSQAKLHEIANKSADNFLNLLCS